MEAIRRRFMQNDAQFLGVTPGPRAPPRAPPSISVGSTDSEASTRDSGKARSNAIVISSEEEDDDDEEEPPQRIPSKPSSSTLPLRTTDQNRVPARQPLKPTVLDSSFPLPIEQNKLKNLGLGETIAMPDFRDDYGFMNSAETEKALRDLVGSAMNEDHQEEVDMEEAIVDGFRDGIVLLPHQVIGRKWMRGREDTTKKCAGGILADDMGLGKTIQTLTRISEGGRTDAEKDAGFSATTLVVCPLALVGQWASEIEKMTRLRVLKHQGTSRTTESSVLKKYDVVVTTYETVQSEYGVFTPAVKDASATSKKKAKPSDDDSDSDIEDALAKIKAKRSSSKVAKKKCALFEVRWLRVVLDEAHNIKNVKTKRAIACCELESKFRWCLTGTPMQNNVAELFSLIKFLRIKPYSDWNKFNEQIAKPITNGRGAGTAMKRLQVILKNIMLRRRKEDAVNGKKLIELPARTVTILPCAFDGSEKAFYAALEEQMGVALDKIMQQRDANKNYMSVLLLLLRLRQACNHPLLVSKDYKKDAEAVEPTAAKQKADGDIDGDDLVAAFGALGVTRKCQVCMASIDDSTAGEGEWRNHCKDCIEIAKQAKQAEIDMPPSAKIRMILTLVKKIDKESDGQEKTIIFSQFTSMLDLIEPFLESNGIKYTRYDGSMQAKDREAALEKIKKSKSTRVILISFKAGSTGLNLTACNNVILVDLWWNPALEEQAFDRAHRYGQTRDVNIYKLKIDGTVEDRILALQEKKRVLAAAALSGDKIKNMRLGMDDLLALFKPGHRDADDSDDE